MQEVNTTSPIDCPEDIKTYNCSIISNTEYLHITWGLYFPDGRSEAITFDHLSSPGDVHDLDQNITSTLLEYRDGYIESTLELRSIYSQNGTMVNCSVGDLSYDVAVIFVNASGT